jgi:D-xylose transport system substrate-binding protein
MRKGILGVAVVGTTLALGLAACSSSSNNSGSTSSSGSTGGVSLSNNKVGILLPDTASSPRWVNSDPTELNKQCIKYGLSCTIDNAQNSAATQETQAQALLNAGVGVLLIVNLDSGSAKTIENEAKAKGVVTIDYDRLTTGGSASYYVSFDNVKVGQLQGTALTQCSQVKSATSVDYTEIDGAATDNNASLFHQGYASVLSKQPGWTLKSDQSGNWDPAAAQTVFQSQLGADPNIKAVMVANDTMAQSVITVLKAQHLNGKVAVSGQDATAAGLQSILAGNQCFTIYKPVPQEADPAIKLAYEILANQKPTAPTTIKDPVSGREVPAFLATPTVITKSNVDQPIKDGYQKYSDVCTAAYVSLCTAAGITQ